MPNQPLTYFKAKIPNGDYEEVAKARFDHSKVGLFMGWDIPFLFSLGWDLTGMGQIGTAFNWAQLALLLITGTGLNWDSPNWDINIL